ENGFTHQALFTLIAIAARVGLEIHTLSGHSHKTEKATLSEVQQRITSNSGTIKDAQFAPSKRELTIETTDGKKISVHYPSDQYSVILANELRDANPSVKYDSKGTGSSAWWSILTGLLPFVLL